MKKTKVSRSDQERVSALADFTWNQLSDIFHLRKKKRPPCYLFLSPQSKGSLNKRSQEEKDFVHIQQSLDGGACLASPPLAYVSASSQVPEEVSHLFVIVHQKQKIPKEVDPELSLNTMILHECFGRFGHQIVWGTREQTKRGRKTLIKKPEDLWSLSHSEGYALGEAIAEQYFSGQLKQDLFRGVLLEDWYQIQKSRKMLSKIYKLSGLPPKKFKFAKDL